MKRAVASVGWVVFGAELDFARDFFAGCFAESDPARECLFVAHVDGKLNCIHLTRHEGDEAEAAWPVEESERRIVPVKAAKAAGGKGPWFKIDATSSEGREIGQPINSDECSEAADGVAC